MTPLQKAAQEMLDAINPQGWHKAEMLRKALADEQTQAVELVGVFDIAVTEKMAVIDYDCTKHSLKSGDKLYTHPALPATGEQIDWQDMYLKAKSEKEALAAKYEKDIGPLAKVAPATDDHAPPRK